MYEQHTWPNMVRIVIISQNHILACHCFLERKTEKRENVQIDGGVIY